MYKRAVEVIDKPPFFMRPISAIFGRISDPILAAALGSAKVLGRSATLRGGGHALDLERAIKEFEKVEKGRPLQIQLGGYRPIKTLKRLWGDPDLRKLEKIVGSLMIPITYVRSEIGRSDHYEPLTHTVRLYHPDLDILRHELGHAEDWQSKRKELFGSDVPKITNATLLMEEYNANRLAMNRLLKEQGATPEEIRRANKIFSASYGSYLFPGMVGAIAGQIYGRYKQPWGRTRKDIKKPFDWEVVSLTPDEDQEDNKKEKSEKKSAMHKQAQIWGGLGGLLGAALGGIAGYKYGPKFTSSIPFLSDLPWTKTLITVPSGAMAGASVGGYIGNLIDELLIQKRYQRHKKEIEQKRQKDKKSKPDAQENKKAASAISTGNYFLAIRQPAGEAPSWCNLDEILPF